MPRPISPARRRSPGLHRGPRRRRRGRARLSRARGRCAADVRLRRQRAPPLFDARRSGRLAYVAWRFPRARALASTPVAPISERSATPCGYPRPPGGGRLRSASPASALGLAFGFRTRPEIADRFFSPAGNSPGLRARHGRFSVVEAALDHLCPLHARTDLRGRCTGSDRRLDCLVVAGAPASPRLGRRRTHPDPCGASALVLFPAGCAGCRMAGSAHAAGSTRSAVGLR